MLALITGASNGIGRDIAIILSRMGYDLILVSRNEQKLRALKSGLKTKVKIISLDLSNPDACYELYNSTRGKDIDILINNAGYGVFGSFLSTDLDTELNMLDLNIKAVHILTKLYLKDFVAKDKGYIMNVSSLAGFLSGPLLSAYYGSKSYVLRLTQALNEELRQIGSNVHICALCPGPVDTGFNSRAGVRFSVKPLNSRYVASYAIRQMFNNHMVIIPGFSGKAMVFLSRFAPTRLMLFICYHIQHSKQK